MYSALNKLLRFTFINLNWTSANNIYASEFITAIIFKYLISICTIYILMNKMQDHNQLFLCE